jgi:hypothetical protein
MEEVAVFCGVSCKFRFMLASTALLDMKGQLLLLYLCTFPSIHSQTYLIYLGDGLKKNAQWQKTIFFWLDWPQ